MSKSNSEKKAIIYRFHEGLNFHLERLEVIKYFNPKIPIHIFAGGEQPTATRDALETIANSYHEHPSQDGDWRWRNGDLVLRDWYRMVGHKFSFDHLYDFEWDMLITKPIEEVYASIPNGSVALTGLDNLSTHDSHWYWTTDEKQRKKASLFLRFMAKEFGMGYPQHFCFWPGAVLPRSYLEALLSFDMADNLTVIGELTTPLLAEYWGFDIVNSGLMPRISRTIPSPIMSPFFHLEAAFPVTKSQVCDGIAKIRQRDEPAIFHPVKEAVSLSDVLAAKQARQKNRPTKFLTSDTRPSLE